MEYNIHGKLYSGFTNMASYFWTGRELTWCKAIQEQQINRQKWISLQRDLCKDIITYLYSTVFTPNQIPKSYLAHRRKNIDFILFGSNVIAQTRLRKLIALWPMASRHFTRHKKCNDFLLPGAESFPTIIWYEWFRSYNFLLHLKTGSLSVFWVGEW